MNFRIVQSVKNIAQFTYSFSLVGIISHAKMLIKIPIRILDSVFMPEVAEWAFVGYLLASIFLSSLSPPPLMTEFPSCAVWAGLTPGFKLPNTDGDL